MSGVLVLLVVHMGVASPCGQFYLPDKEFRSVCPHVAMGPGPYLHLILRNHEVAGVWPLRIPLIQLVPVADSMASGWMKWPFLLIVRTGRVVTDQTHLARGFDPIWYRQILGVPSI